MAEPKLIAAAVRPFKALFVSDTFAGVLLIAVAVLAIVAANTPLANLYHHSFHGILAWTPILKLNTLHAWINDGLMAVFFFLVGLEVKREMIAGNLADGASRRLPVLAAVAGMAAPALVYLAIAGREPLLEHGWAIPAATDIAFAMGVIGLLGTRVPGPLRLFLLTVAIVDDIGAVLLIALFYTQDLSFAWLFAAVLVAAFMIGLNKYGVRRTWLFVVVALVLWYCVLHSGIHATIAGVVAALTIPMRNQGDSDGHSMLETMEHRLVGWNAHVIVPLFGFANAGLALGGLELGDLFDPLPLAIGAGLVIGKQAGIFGSIAMAQVLGFAQRPGGASWHQIWGTAALCGIGFTMSLFIGALAFPHHPALIEEAKLGVLAGSFVSALLGYVILRLARAPKTGG